MHSMTKKRSTRVELLQYKRKENLLWQIFVESETVERLVDVVDKLSSKRCWYLTEVRPVEIEYNLCRVPLNDIFTESTKEDCWLPINLYMY